MLTTHQFRTQLKELTMTDKPGPGPIHDGDDVEGHGNHSRLGRADAAMTDDGDDVEGHGNHSRLGRADAAMTDDGDDVEGHKFPAKP